MKLTKDQKEALKSMRKHEWFKVLEAILEDITVSIWKQFVDTNIDLTNEKTLKVLEENRLYIKAMWDFIKKTEQFTQEIYSPKI